MPGPGVVPGPGGAWSRGCLVLGGSGPRGCLVETPQMATAASGPHHTGMHSCSSSFDTIKSELRCRRPHSFHSILN